MLKSYYRVYDIETRLNIPKSGKAVKNDHRLNWPKFTKATDNDNHKTGKKLLYRRIFHDVTLPRQRKNWRMTASLFASIMAAYKCERNIVLQLE